VYQSPWLPGGITGVRAWGGLGAAALQSRAKQFLGNHKIFRAAERAAKMKNKYCLYCLYLLNEKNGIHLFPPAKRSARNPEFLLVIIVWGDSGKAILNETLLSTIYIVNNRW